VGPPLPASRSPDDPEVPDPAHDDGTLESYDRYEIYVRGIPSDRLG
jgi:hypothetical protein